MSEIIPASIDVEHLAIIRKNVEDFLRRMADEYLATGAFVRVLDIGPQAYHATERFFEKGAAVETLDIDPESGCTYIGDICRQNESISDGAFDCVVCTEVLEHTLHPFDAVDEIWRILKPGGKLLVSTPFNFRIHGPLPDCWRFTEHGLRVLLRRFEILELHSVETPDRPLMPIHYTVVAQKTSVR